MEDVVRSAKLLEGRARRTPLEYSPALSEIAGCEVHLKLENLQRTGSFKFRGALSALSRLKAQGGHRHVVTASAGNHGLGVALAARGLGLPATIFVPASTPEIKKLRIGRWASLTEVDGGYDEAHEEAASFAGAEGATYIHAFSDPAVVAGQGTVGLEIIDDLPEVATIVVPVGGGGLVGGVGVVIRDLRPRTRIIGVQSEQTTAMHDSLEAGELRSPPTPPTLCEGLSGDIDEQSLALARRVVDEMVLVPETAVRRAIEHLYFEDDLVAEGSAAVGVAALLHGRLPKIDGPIAVVITGGNIDPAIHRSIVRGPGRAAENQTR